MTSKPFVIIIILLVTIALLTLNSSTGLINAQSGDESSPANQSLPVSQSQQKASVFHRLTIDDGILWFCNYGAGLLRHAPALNTWK